MDVNPLDSKKMDGLLAELYATPRHVVEKGRKPWRNSMREAMCQVMREAACESMRSPDERAISAFTCVCDALWRATSGLSRMSLRSCGLQPDVLEPCRR